MEIEPSILKGTIQIPPSKSDAQRAIICAALAKGNTTLTNCGDNQDVRNIQGCIEKLGAKIEKNEDQSLLISGIQNFPLTSSLNVGESGLGIRILTSVCAAHPGTFFLTGNGSLLNRKMDFFDNEFIKMKVNFKSNNGYLPFELSGPLQAGEYSVDGSQSSQYISGLLMAMPLLPGHSILYVENPTSLPYLKMTLDTLSKFGIEIEHKNFTEYKIKGNQHYTATTYTIEGDWSAASYWLVASALGMEIKVSGLSMSSSQADKKILDAFMNASCSVVHSDGISINGTKRIPLDFDCTHCPDLFPALVTFAALTDGISKLSGVHRLSTKESDRGITLKEEFQKLGVHIEIKEDQMLIHGKKSISGGTVRSHHDHRIAMCLGIAGLFANEKIELESAEAVSKSYPEFWRDLDSLEKSMK